MARLHGRPDRCPEFGWQLAPSSPPPTHSMTREGRCAHERSFPDLGALRHHIWQLTGIEPERQVLIHREVLTDASEVLLHGDVDLSHAGLFDTFGISVYMRPEDEQVITVVTRLNREVATIMLTANSRVSDLKRFVARRFKLAPCCQELRTRSVSMMETDSLGMFSIHNCIEVEIIKLALERRQLASISVIRDLNQGGGYKTFPMDAQDTFDVLLGKLEAAGMIEEGEEVTFSSPMETYENWRTFGYYHLHDCHVRMHRGGN